jgi:Protein of unknown function (DUF3800)
VDEAGDLTLFDKRGRSIVGSEGVSRHFMAGLVELPDPNLAPRKLENLRKRFMTDPYFIGVPSTQPARNTTAVYFHANDNIREVRYEVIKLLPSLGAKATIAIKRKEHLAKLHRLKPDSRVEREAPNTVYDELITEIFRGNLHPVDRVNLVLRSATRESAAGHSKRRWTRRGALPESSRVKPDPPITISFAHPSESAGLQVVDDYLWAVQRMYATGTNQRFYRALEPQYALVMDLDDRRGGSGGRRYSGKNKVRPHKI